VATSKGHDLSLHAQGGKLLRVFKGCMSGGGRKKTEINVGKSKEPITLRQKYMLQEERVKEGRERRAAQKKNCPQQKRTFETVPQCCHLIVPVEDENERVLKKKKKRRNCDSGFPSLLQKPFPG